MEFLRPIFYFVIFPGFLFTAAVGILASWIDRKVTARVQWRVGPPWYQPLIDIIKLMGKETIVPRGGSRMTFLLAPLLGLVAVTLVSTLIWITNLWPQRSFLGDLIVILYLLIIPSLAIILGGAASKNPLSSLGASREMKLVLAYELPFILAVFVPVIKSGGLIRIGELVSYQLSNGAFLASWSGAIAFAVVVLFCMQAKLALVPFDIPEAETEIMAGPLIEYSGAPLAIFKLTKMMMLFVVPTFIITIFWGGMVFSGLSSLWSILKYIALLVLITLIRNTSPRIRIDQAIRFFWGPVTLLAIIAIVLALLGQ